MDTSSQTDAGSSQQSPEQEPPANQTGFRWKEKKTFLKTEIRTKKKKKKNCASWYACIPLGGSPCSIWGGLSPRKLQPFLPSDLVQSPPRRNQDPRPPSKGKGNWDKKRKKKNLMIKKKKKEERFVVLFSSFPPFSHLSRLFQFFSPPLFFVCVCVCVTDGKRVEPRVQSLERR